MIISAKKKKKGGINLVWDVQEASVGWSGVRILPAISDIKEMLIDCLYNPLNYTFKRNLPQVSFCLVKVALVRCCIKT